MVKITVTSPLICSLSSAAAVAAVALPLVTLDLTPAGLG
jgi:hypothetical protein